MPTLKLHQYSNGEPVEIEVYAHSKLVIEERVSGPEGTLFIVDGRGQYHVKEARNWVVMEFTVLQDLASRD